MNNVRTSYVVVSLGLFCVFTPSGHADEADAAGHRPRNASVLDGHSFLPIILGREPRDPRKWVFFYYDPRPGWDKEQFTRRVFVRNKRFKLYSDGSLFDVSADVLEHQPFPADSTSADVQRARRELQNVLDRM